MSPRPEPVLRTEVQLVSDRRRVLLGGGLVLAFFAAGVKAHARGNPARVNPAGPQPLSNTETHVTAGAAFAQVIPAAFIRIAPDNAITLIIPHTEVGQGIYTGECMLLCEELEAGLDQVKAVPAPPDEAMYKQPLLQLQATGGSTSIRAAWTPMRKAGAAARIMLIQAAAQEWGVDPASCRAERAVIRHPPSGRSVTYGQVAEAAARLPAPQQVTLKDPGQWRLLGRRLQRVDTPAKANGSAQFGIDIMVPGMKFATVENSPVLGGRLVSVDEGPARAVPGVLQVVRLPNAVAVVGEHFWAARQGLAALKPVWDAAPEARFSSADLWASLEATSLNGQGAVAVQTGDFDRAFQQADRRHERVYRQPLLCHAPMEPQAAVVHVRGGEVEVWCGTQVPTRVQSAVAQVCGVAPEKVTLNNQLMGGAYGRKLETDYVEQAALIAKACPFPVKLVWSREQDMRHDNYRPMYVDRISAGVDLRGEPLAWRHRVTAASVTARWAPSGMRPNGVDPDAVEEAEDPIYGQFPNMLVDYVQWRPPPGLVVSWWRGVGPTHTIFVVESFVDELAFAAGRDPYEYRHALLREVPRGRAVLEAATRAAGWGSPLPANCGRGVIVQKSFGSYIAAVVEAGVSDDGDVTLRRVTAAVDCGYTVNPNLVKQQIEGGLIFGLTAALHQGVTVEGGRVQQSNFNDYRMLRINETPPIEVLHLPTANPPGGIGEAGTTAAAPALTNAIFAATGVRLRELPIERALLRRGARKRRWKGTWAPPVGLIGATAAATSDPNARSTASRSPSPEVFPSGEEQDAAPPPHSGGGGSALERRDGGGVSPPPPEEAP
jgi:isoquinoline 1-oxidoreductase beta subunit